jgi:hypothetical protein
MIYFTDCDMEGKFWSHVEPMMDDRGCWEWTAGTKNGYGHIGFWDKERKLTKTVKAHRISWEIHNGPIPKLSGVHGGVIRHKCDNRSCVNPKHLLLGTQNDNVRDQVERGRLITPIKSAYCNKGHFKEGKIYCRECVNNAQRQRLGYNERVSMREQILCKRGHERKTHTVSYLKPNGKTRYVCKACTVVRSEGT